MTMLIYNSTDIHFNDIFKILYHLLFMYLISIQHKYMTILDLVFKNLARLKEMKP